MGEGVLAGYPVVDMKATPGRRQLPHRRQLSEMAFKVAASQALKRAFPEADPILLEPILEVEVIVPDEYMGDVMGQITSKRGHVLGMDSNNGMQHLRAQVPQAEMFHYATELRSHHPGPRPVQLEAGPLRRGPAQRRREGDRRARGPG